MSSLGANSLFGAKNCHQLFAAVIVNILNASFGTYNGWVTASLLELRGVSSPLEAGPLSNHEIGWLTCSSSIGAIFGSLLGGLLAKKIGHKRTLLLMAMPCMLGWLVIPFARVPWHLYAALILGGVAGGGSSTAVPVYVTELAEDSVRGVLGSLMVLSSFMGIVFSVAMGYFFKCVTMAWISSSFPLLFFICFLFMPETPQHFAQLNKMSEAEHSLRYYRNIGKCCSKERTGELAEELSRLRCPEQAKEEGGEQNFSWSDFTDPKTRKVFLIGLGLVLANQLSGCFGLITYTAVIFKDAGSSLPPAESSIIVSGILLLGAYISTLLVERLGRKLLLLISSVGIGLGECSMGIYSYLTALGYETSSFNWLLIAGFSFTLFIGAWGLLTLPYLVISEIVPPRKRTRVMTILMTLMYLLSGFVVKLWPILMESIALHGTVFLLAGFCFTSALFIAIFVPETKGQSIETILSKL